MKRHIPSLAAVYRIFATNRILSTLQNFMRARHRQSSLTVNVWVMDYRRIVWVKQISFDKSGLCDTAVGLRICPIFAWGEEIKLMDKSDRRSWRRHQNAPHSIQFLSKWCEHFREFSHEMMTQRMRESGQERVSERKREREREIVSEYV